MATTLAVVTCLAIAMIAPASSSAGTTNPFKGRIDATSIGSPLTPTAVSTGPGNRVYVGDSATGTVYALDSSGNLLFPFEAGATPSGTLSARSIAIAPGGGFFIPEPNESFSTYRFDAEGHFQGVFSNLVGTFFGERPTSAAIDAAGNIYLLIGGLVEKWNSSETFVTSWSAGASSTPNIAVTPAGEVFVTESSSVVRTDSNGNVLSRVTGADVEDPNFSPTGVALEPNGDFYVSDAQGGVIYRFGPANELLGRTEASNLPAGTPFTPSGLAVDGAGTLYAVDAAAEAVLEFGPPVNVPTPSIGAVDQLGGGVVTLHGNVDPEGLEVSECVFEYAPEGSTTFESVPCGQTGSEIGTGTGDVAVDANLSGPLSGLYRFRLRAANVNGSVTSASRAFSIGRPPAVKSQEAGQLTPTEASITAQVDPGALEASYKVEYGLTDSYGSASPTRAVHLGNEAVPIQVFIADLQPSTTYHFRVVAENELGRVAGNDQTFTTKGVVDACPNVLFRVGPGAMLPECRAYEQVTPVEKKGMYIGAVGFQARPDGSGLVYSTNATPAFAEAESAPRNSRFEAIRSEGGWRLRAKLDVPINAPTSLTSKSTIAVSEDLSHALVVSDRALTPGAVEPGCNLYRRDVESGQLTLVASSSQPLCFTSFAGIGVESSTFIGGSSDFSSIVFNSALPFLQAPFSGSSAVYEWSVGSGLTIASRTPSGEAMQWASASSSAYEPELRRYSPTTGTTIFFGETNAGENGVYAHLANGKTIALSVSQIPGASSEPHPGIPLAISRSGRYALFYTTDSTPLAEGAVSGSENFYLYDLEGETLKALGFKAFESGIAAISEELTAIYWSELEELHVWRNGQISAVGPYAPPPFNSGYNVSPNGRFFAFATGAKATDFENEGRIEVYFYDAQTEELHCASCPGPGMPLDGEANLPANQQEIGNNRIPKAVTDAGQVFFDSTSRLVAADTNGMKDVYEYRDGRQLLLSPGDAKFGASFVEAGLDSRDVFIKTAQQIVPSDTDNSYDIYDARIGGGLSSQYEPPPVQCSAEACQRASGAPPTPLAATESTAGQGTKATRSNQCKKKPNGRKPSKHCVSKKKHKAKHRPKAKRGQSQKVNNVNRGQGK